MTSRYDKPQSEDDRQKRQWIDDFIEEDTNRSPDEVTLRYRALTTLIRDANDSDLLNINKFIKNELLTRAKSIDLVLKQNIEDGEWPDEVQNLIYEKFIMPDYIEKHYSDYSQIKKQYFIDFGTAFLNKNTNMNDHSYKVMKKKGISIGFSSTFLDNFGDRILLLEEEGEFDKFLEDSSENPYLISIMKELQNEGISIPGIMLYTLQLPLGASYLISQDHRFGEYPIILN